MAVYLLVVRAAAHPVTVSPGTAPSLSRGRPRRRRQPARHLAPRAIPAAAIRPGAAAFAAGLVILLIGVALRGWSFAALGQYFTFTVMVSSDQPVVTAGPYRVLRHPSYIGILLACVGVGLAAANWAGLAAMTLLPLAILLWRIHIEENALLATLGDRYRAYASHHKRLVPLVW